MKYIQLINGAVSYTVETIKTAPSYLFGPKEIIPAKGRRFANAHPYVTGAALTLAGLAIGLAALITSPFKMLAAAALTAVLIKTPSAFSASREYFSSYNAAGATARKSKKSTADKKNQRNPKKRSAGKYRQ